MNIFNEFLTRIRKNEGMFIFKKQLLDEIKKSNKDQYLIKLERNKGLMIVAIPIKNNYKI